MYAPKHLSSLKLALVETGCAHNLLSKTVSDHLPAAVQAQPDSWNTTAEVLVSRISDESILEIAFLVGQTCMLCLDKGVLAWRGDAILLVDKDCRLLANKVPVLRSSTLPPGMEAQAHL